MAEYRYGAVPTVEISQDVTSIPPLMVEVTAPMTLDSGYHFNASYNGVVFSVTVPVGGIKAGEKFVVPFVAPPPENTMMLIPGDSPPLGKWKDGLCSCCKFGLCHPSLCNVLVCPQILLAQVMTRLKLDILGRRSFDGSYLNTFGTMVLILLSVFGVCVFLNMGSVHSDFDENGNLIVTTDTTWKSSIVNFITTFFLIFTLYLIVMVRRATRQRYRIPEEACGGAEDILCGVLCGCCTLTQVARQTANYEERRPVCCSPTGMRSTVPPIVV
eukprot:CAMPEP_0118677326 /NCGR_PEP_ID=MMETSP0800-20121206/2565_1 /TAXON_ID=210618 ORGANISM="Striatella unipunctata, Strain CCMP2910" /NCGR_SAMPLE_ID=MMETSP0800 /ASSEMBLY_ACC=CAM_ASM_000638 /LENGTH=270 /DNA_ID=CAMNT_0006572987 /DNA_START=13 /DNA_END=825 /DNA_ORIENTATION=+